MERRTIIAGIIVTAFSYAISLGASELYDYASTSFFSRGAEYFSPLGGLLKALINCLYWFIPGFFIGFVSRSKPIKSAAMVGFIAGAAVAIIGLAIQSTQIHESKFIYAALFFYLARIIELVALFTLSASFGYVTAEHRQALASGSSRSRRSLGTG